MKLYRLFAISKKTIKNYVRDKRSLLFFLMFPAMTYLFYYLIPAGDDTKMFPIVFLPVNILFCSLQTMGAIIAEEKEKGTLRSLMYSNVKPIEYFLGNALIVWLLTCLSCSLFLPLINLSGIYYFYFYLFVTLSSICSMVLGGVVGILSKNQMSCNAMCAPITIILGMLPTFGAMSASLGKVTKYLYTSKFADTIAEVVSGSDVIINFKIFLVYFVNFIVCLVIFYFVYKNNRLED